MNCDLLMTTAEMETDREKWLDIRRGSIGGSDAAAVVGLSTWKSAYTLWLEKTGQLVEGDKGDCDAVHFGNVLESVVAKEFCQREGKRVKRCGLYRSREFPFLTGSFDRLLVGEAAGLEIKTASSFRRKEWEAGEIPPPYLLQCQHYMLVSGLSKWYIAALIGGQSYYCWKVERNESDIAALLEAETAFWDKVQRGIMPVIDGSDSTTDSLRAIYAGGKVAPLPLPWEAAGLVSRFEELKELETSIKAEKQELQNKLCAMLEDNELGIVGEGDTARKVSWKSYPGKITIDSKALKADLPDIYAKYARQGAAYRRFSV